MHLLGEDCSLTTILADFIISGGAAMEFCIKSLNEISRQCFNFLMASGANSAFCSFCSMCNFKDQRFISPRFAARKTLRVCIDSLSLGCELSRLKCITTWRKKKYALGALPGKPLYFLPQLTRARHILLRRQSACEICFAFSSGNFFLERLNNYQRGKLKLRAVFFTVPINFKIFL